jgi:RNA polymerase sigma factor (sigma-70 family)
MASPDRSEHRGPSPSAWAEWFAGQYQRAVQLTSKNLARGNRDAAEDLVSEGLLRATRALGRQEAALSGDNLTAYVLRATRTAAYDATRAQNFLPRELPQEFYPLTPADSEGGGGPLIQEGIDRESNPEEQALEGESLRHLHDTMVRVVGQDTTDALLGYYVYGYTKPQIAAIQGIPQGTVQSRIARGLDTLKSSIDESGAEKQKDEVPVPQSSRISEITEALRGHPGSSAAQIAEIIGTSRRTVEKNLVGMRETGIVGEQKQLGVSTRRSPSIYTLTENDQNQEEQEREDTGAFVLEFEAETSAHVYESSEVLLDDDASIVQMVGFGGEIAHVFESAHQGYSTNEWEQRYAQIENDDHDR